MASARAGRNTAIPGMPVSELAPNLRPLDSLAAQDSSSREESLTARDLVHVIVNILERSFTQFE